MDYDVVVIGAGAAGMMAAGIAATQGKKVLLMEKMEKPGRKIRITGKGRCNLTNMRTKEEFLEKVRANAEFFTPAFEAFTNKATVKFFRRIGVPLDEERGERVFPKSGKAWDVADAMVEWCTDMGVEIICNSRVDRIIVLGDFVSGVSYVTKKGFPRNISCSNVIICTGGVSYPATGSTGDGYMFAHDTGHNIEEVRPALVPLETSYPMFNAMQGLMLRNVGIRLFADGELLADEFGEMEFSDRGLAGAAVLRVSRRAVDALIAEKTVEMSLDLKPALTKEILQERVAREMAALEPDAPVNDLLRKLTPRELVPPITQLLDIPPRVDVSFFTQDKIDALIDLLKDFRMPVSDYRPFEEAIVTAGGVDVTNVDPLTMQSRLIKGMYFAGEVLDIDADTGGFNLQVAFSTGHLAGELKNGRE